MTTYYLELYEYSENADIKQISTKNLKEYIKDFTNELNNRSKVENLALSGVVKSLPQDNYCNVCNLPTDGEKCYSKRCPV